MGKPTFWSSHPTPKNRPNLWEDVICILKANRWFNWLGLVFLIGKKTTLNSRSILLVRLLLLEVNYSTTTIYTYILRVHIYIYTYGYYCVCVYIYTNKNCYIMYIHIYIYIHISVTVTRCHDIVTTSNFSQSKKGHCSGVCYVGQPCPFVIWFPWTIWLYGGSIVMGVSPVIIHFRFGLSMK